jgi:uncharacterized repeat protein (TIGR03803 family)
VIFKTDSCGGNYSVQYQFDNFEQNTYGSLIKAINGKFYGMSCNGGDNGLGVIFEYSSINDSVKILHHFDGSNSGAHPNGSLLQAFNEKLYGMTCYGGMMNQGVVFEYNLSNKQFTKLHDFGNYPGGRYPYGSLIEGSNGKLYGMTKEGGGSGTGIIFEIDLAGPSLTILYSFGTGANGTFPLGDLLEASANKFYGLASSGGVDNGGCLFEYDLTLGFTKLHDFSGSPSGHFPRGSLVMASNGKLYGMTSGGSGTSYYGVIFEYSIPADLLITRYEFNFNNGYSPQYTRLVEGATGWLFGMTNRGGMQDDGVIFKFSYLSGTFTLLYSFNLQSANENVFGSLIESTPGVFLGMTNVGGNLGRGTIFRFDTLTRTHAVRHHFDSYNRGQKPYGNLTASSNGKFYGLTREGGAFNLGTLFEYDPFTGDYVKWHDFDGAATGAHPHGELTEAGNGKLYGLTYDGGTANDGVLFEFDPSNGSFSKKHDFTGTAGRKPFGSLLLASNAKLYGMTWQGGTNNWGVLFEYDLTTYSAKVYFNNSSQGRNPEGSLIQASDGNLYGLARYGGTSDQGTLFEYNIATATLTSKFSFGSISSKGQQPTGDLIQANDGKLYGMTTVGGSSGMGTIFSFELPGLTHSVLHNFNGTATGSFPYGSLLESSDGKIYGLTREGGANNLGVLFSLGIGSKSFTKKLDLDASSGSKPQYSQLIKVLMNATWSGAVSSEWENAANWEQGEIPGAFASVRIKDVSGASGNHPFISSNIFIRELEIQDNASLNFEDGTAIISGK